MKARRILVPIDFSDRSRAALDEAATLARQLDAELTLLYVEVWPETHFLDAAIVAPAGQVMARCEEAEARLEGWAEEVGDPRPWIRIKVETGNAVEVINRFSKEHELVVMATHGRSGIERFLLGSVAERVVRGAACSVLIVRPAT